jgi:uncharacterized protein
MARGAEPATLGVKRDARVGSGEIPLFPLNTVLFPGGPLPLRIFEPRYVDMVRACMRGSAPFGVVLIRAGQEAGAVSSAADVGTAARIIDFDQMPDGLLGITCCGEQRFRVEERRVEADGLNVGTVTWLAPDATMALPPQHAHLGQLLKRVMPQLRGIYQQLPAKYDDAGWVGSRLAEILPISLAEKQALLEMDDPVMRLDQMAPLIQPADED